MIKGTPTAHLTRRAVLSGLIAGVPALSFAAPDGAVRPRPRPRSIVKPGPVVAGSLSELVSKTNIDGHTAAVLVDLRTGAVLDAHQPGLPLPPASVAKVVTTLYALDTLGPKHTFSTKVIATGPVQQGRVQGDLYLVGGGDPHLDSDDLAALVDQLAERGITSVSGKFYVVSSALPLQRQIDAAQPVYVGYNPAVSGLNLNFNRVFFEWEKVKGEYSMVLEARARNFSPAVESVALSLVERKSPVYAYRSLNGRDDWSVALAALGKKGGRWLPVRAPGDYAGDVFRTIALSKDMRLPRHRLANTAPAGSVVAELTSSDLLHILRGMLRYSNNLTAEVMGMAATKARAVPFETLEQSGSAMVDWAAQTSPVSAARFVDHSGLSGRSRIAPDEMVALLRTPGSAGVLRDLGKKYPVLDKNGKPGPYSDIAISAKSGTLNFTRCLSGVVDNQTGGQFAFAVFTCNFARRRQYAGIERPPGSRAWRNRAQRQERTILRRWAGIVSGLA